VLGDLRGSSLTQEVAAQELWQYRYKRWPPQTDTLTGGGLTTTKPYCRTTRASLGEMQKEEHDLTQTHKKIIRVYSRTWTHPTTEGHGKG